MCWQLHSISLQCWSLIGLRRYPQGPLSAIQLWLLILFFLRCISGRFVSVDSSSDSSLPPLERTHHDLSSLHRPRLCQISLERNALSNPYRSRLYRAFDHLSSWLRFRSVPSLIFLDIDRSSEVLCAYIQDCHDRKVAFWLVRHSVLAAQARFPLLKTHIPRVWRTIRAWSLQRPMSARTPLPRRMLEMMMLESLFRMTRARGNHERRLWLSFFMCLGLGFNGLCVQLRCFA